MIKFGFVITWTWIATKENVDADDLWRGRVEDVNHCARAYARKAITIDSSLRLDGVVSMVWGGGGGVFNVLT